MICTRCECESIPGEVWPRPDRCPECWTLRAGLRSFHEKLGGVDFDIRHNPRVAREISIRGHAPGPMLAFGRNGFHPKRAVKERC